MKKRNFTRIIASVLTVLMLANLLPLGVFAVDANDSGNDPMILTVSSETGMPGETVQVTLEVSNNPGIASLKFDVEYDSVLTLTAVEFGSAFAAAMITAPEPYTNPQTITMISPLADISENGVFATLTFTINENVADGYVANVNIRFDPEDIYNGEYTPVELSVVNGKVSVYHGIPGDIDGNKKVNTKDAIALFRYVSGWDVVVDHNALDVNGDSRVNTKDAIELFRYVAGWEGITLLYGPVKHIHNLSLMEGKDATCTEDGNAAYFYCAGCGKYYSDATATTEIAIEDTVLPASGHAMNAVEAEDATCTEDGTVAYWNCANCGGHFADEQGESKLEYADTVIPAAGHALTEVTEKAASCTESGNVTYWYCETCGKSFMTEDALIEINPEDAAISATGHALQAIAAKDAGCTENGNIVYWYCTACNCCFADSEAITEIALEDTVILATGHGEHLQHVEAVEATVDAKGNVEYWKCIECGKCYSEAEAKNEITEESTVIPILPNYTITFVDDKNWPAGKKVKFAQNEDLLLTTYLPPEVAGYTFGGWYTTSTFEDANKKDYVFAGNTANLILYAKWNVIEYEITYINAPENSNPATYTVEDKIALTMPKWAGLIFSHWTDKNGNIVTGIEKGTTGDIELEANWKYAQNLAVSNPDKYTYVGGALDSQSRYYFIFDIGTIENVVLDTKLSVKYYGATTEAYTDTYSYKVQTAEAQSAAYTIANSVIESTEWSRTTQWIENHKEGATWGVSYCPEIEVKKIKVKALEASYGYTDMDESSYTETELTVDTGTTGTQTTSQTASSISYLFEEAASSSVTVNLTPATSPAGTYNYVRAADVKVYAIVTYDPSNGEYYLDIYSMVYKVHDTTLFELSGNEQYSVNIASCDQLDFEIPYAQIPEMFYTVQYDANGGTGEMLKSVHEVNVSSTLLPNAFTREGYTFGGWKTTSDGSTVLYVDKTDICDIAGAGETVTLYAHWIKNSYTIQYDGNKPDNASSDVLNMPGDTACQYDTDVTLGTQPSLAGWTFGGWYRDKACTVKAGNAGQVLSTPNLTAVNEGSVTLYAKWTANTYTVVYNANGGSGTMSNSTFTYDVSGSLRGNAYTRDCYTFLGWSTSSTAKTATYTNEQSVRNLATSGKVTLYAVWIKTSASSDFSGRSIKLGEGDTHTDKIITGMSKKQLLDNGYKTIKIVVVFDAKREDLISVNSAQLAIVANDTALCGVNFALTLLSQSWTNNITETYSINVSDLNDDGSFSIKWSHLSGSGIGEHWYLGTTSVTVTAQSS